MDIVYDGRIRHHGAFYGSTGSGKSMLIRELCLNGFYSHCRKIVFMNGKSDPMCAKFVGRMREEWKTNVYSYAITNEAQLTAKICDIEEAFVKRRVAEYGKLNRKPPDDVNKAPGMDDLHKEVLDSQKVAQKFQSVRHVGIQLLFITQSFKNTTYHDLIKENYGYVVFFNLTHNRIALRN